MNTKLVVAGTVLALLSIFIATNPIAPLLDPPSIASSVDELHSSEIVPVTGAFGPESLAFDPNGEGPYTGVADGRVLKWNGGSWVDFAVTTSQRPFKMRRCMTCHEIGKFPKHEIPCLVQAAQHGCAADCVRPFAPELEHVCGRPLGLRFSKKTGDLYIADAYFGLRVVGPAGGLATEVVTGVDNQTFLFTNDMDIDEVEDVIYFSDSSTKFQRRQFMAAVFSGDKTGRLLKYDMSSKEVKVLLDGLAFANGVSLSKDRSFVLVAQSTTSMITRLWLQGPNAGKSEVFAELPGFPDNIRRNSEGEFWVGLHSKRGTLSNLIVSYPWVGKTLLKLPLSFKQLHILLASRKAHATAMKLSEAGEVVQVLEDCEGAKVRFISEVEENDGKLWIGSVLMPFMAIYKLH